MYRQYIADVVKKEEMGCGNSHQSKDNSSPSAEYSKTSGEPPPCFSPPHHPPSLAPTSGGQALKDGNKQPTARADASAISKEEIRNRVEAQKKELEDLLKKADEAMALLEKAAGLGKVEDKGITKDAILGNVDMICPSPAKIVRIFTSSTFTDTKQERNILMKYGYPKIKEHCRQLGYEFQVVDMRWGVRDEATDDHMGTELCLKELKLCQRLSTGPNFVSLLSHKYGYTAFPRVIVATEFEKIFDNIDNQETKDLFRKWYTRDDNAVPPAYILSSISTHIPDFLSREKEKQKAAKNQWWEESEKMQDALEETAKKIFDVATARKFIMSVTETEVEEGLLKVDDPSKNCFWLKRNIEDIDKQESSYELSRFMECIGSEKKVTKARTMLKELKEDKMQRKLDPSKILNYNVHWNPELGINPEKSEEHKKYLENLCEDFIANMKNMIDQSIVQKEKIDDSLVDECIQHIRFCHSKCEGFAGRKETLQKIQEYLLSNNNQPLVLHGTSGTGKTSIMAMAAKMAKTWLNQQPVVVVRFLGTTPDSSNLMSLLYSICSQIRRAYTLPKLPRRNNINQQILDFKQIVNKGRPNQQLVIVLDSLDQLDPAFNAHSMAWLADILPPTTKIIVSTLPEKEYQCYQALQMKIKATDNFVRVPVLDNRDVVTILDNWLEMRQRKLTPQQRDVVLNTFEKCPTPLFLKMSFEESTNWKSFTPLAKTVLQDTVRSSIGHLFETLEKMHGKILVSRALAYLTLAHNGVSEAELEDILSCDDDVLNDVYMYWTPPMRRLPPLLWVRIRTDLSQYLVERGADGARVLYWYHRQFIEAAEARYCADVEQNKLIHSYLADFFSGTWADGRKKPFTNSKGETGEEDRHVATQQLKFGDKEYNLRALNNLPYHRTKAGQELLLQQQCLANVHFLLNKLEALPLTAVFDDFTAAKMAFPDNQLINMIYESLLLSQKGLGTDPGQLVPQLRDRLEENEITRPFIEQMNAYPRINLEPSIKILDQPGGQLVHCIAAHKTDIDMLDMTMDGNHVLTVCQADKEVSVWSIKEARLKRVLVNPGECTKALFCNDDKWIAYEKDKLIKVEDAETGKPCCEVKTPLGITHTSICVAGKDKTLLLVFSKNTCNLYDLTKDGQLINTVPYSGTIKFGAMSVPYGSEHYCAVCDNDQYFITVLDLRTMTFMEKFRGFERVLLEDGDYDEYEVDMVAIYPDETHLAYISMMNSAVVFADFSGNVLRKIPGDEKRNYRSIDFTLDGKYFYIFDNKLLRIFDNATLEEIHSLDHSKDLLGALTRDMKTVVTIAEDSNLRIWDLTRKKQEATENIKESINGSGELSRVSSVSKILPLPCPRYVVVFGQPVKNADEYALGVYDYIIEKFVKFRKMEFTGRPTLIAMDEKHVIFRVSRKLFIIDLDTMDIQASLQGSIGKRLVQCVYTKRKQIVCVSKGDKHLKVHDALTGKVEFILKAGQTQNIEGLAANEAGTVACANTDDGPLLLFDLINKKHLYNIPHEPAYSTFFGQMLYINDEGTKLVFNVDMPLPGMGPKGNDIDHLVVWDIDNKKELFRCHDVAYERKYKLLKSDEMTSLEELDILDKKLIFTRNMDNIMRVYDFDTGKLLHRLVGHTTSVYLSLNEKSPYILSYGSLNEEDCIRIWDKQTFKQLATFTLDKTINNVHWDASGKFFFAVKTLGIPKMFRWNIKFGHEYVSNVDANSLPKAFSGPVEYDTLKISVPQGNEKMVVPEDGDPDSDPEVPSSDEEDDADDDD